MELFHHQARFNPAYKEFTELLGRTPATVDHIDNRPFMPISFFKSRVIKSGDWEHALVFRSSGTSGTGRRSEHPIKSASWAAFVSNQIFRQFYPGSGREILALLPSYLENGDSSLVHMVKDLVDRYNVSDDVFFMHDFEALHKHIQQLLNNSDKTILLIGVSFALLDYAERFPLSDNRLEIMFTGGMKNRQKELDYAEIYKRLSNAYPLSRIVSEYGMTELLSQAYCVDNDKGRYLPGRSLDIRFMEITDPMSAVTPGKTGQLAAIDLANIHTVSFIMTEDLGHMWPDGRFSVLGRLAQSDLRGCNLLYQS